MIHSNVHSKEKQVSSSCLNIVLWVFGFNFCSDTKFGCYEGPLWTLNITSVLDFQVHWLYSVVAFFPFHKKKRFSRIGWSVNFFVTYSQYSMRKFLHHNFRGKYSVAEEKKAVSVLKKFVSGKLSQEWANWPQMCHCEGKSLGTANFDMNGMRPAVSLAVRSDVCRNYISVCVNYFDQ